MKLKKMFALVIMVLLLVSPVLSIPVSSLDEKTKGIVIDYDANKTEIEIIDWDYFKENNGEIYDQSDDYYIVIIDGEILLLKKK